MKKIVLVLFIIAGLSLCFVMNTNQNYFLTVAQNYNAKVSFYLIDEQNFDDCEYIQNGSGGILSCSSNRAVEVYDKISKLTGISFAIKGNCEELSKIIGDFDIKIKSQQNITNSITTYLGYSNKLKNFIKVDNQKVNVQIATNGDNIVVGTPIILGSY